ncbi:MAG: DUF3299 domain-containing protein [Aureliella sp.]
MRKFHLVVLAFAASVSMFAGSPASAQTTSSKSGDEAAAGSRGAAVTRPLAESRTSRQTARSKGDITFDDLKFDIEKGGKFDRSMLTKDIESLNKQTVRLRGYILPNSVYKNSGIDQFVLVRDNMECCFGPGAAIYDCVLVNMEKGKTTDFTTKPVAVRGKFEIEEFKFPDGTLAAIYKMTASEVK